MGSQTFTNTASGVKFNPPTGVKILNIEVRGAGSGTRQGGRVVGRMKVDNNDVLWIKCGEAGKTRTGALQRIGGLKSEGGGGSGGNATGTGVAGNGGGGATVIRMYANDGRIVAVAGGAGGTSGDNGLGGEGGSTTGGGGLTGTQGSGEVAPATGGTPNQAGRGGTTALGAEFYGRDGTQARLGRAGGGGTSLTVDTIGGGGGGGGFFPGAGGFAGIMGVSPGGGGSGGSNFTGGLYSATSYRGTGGTGDGRVIITWEDPGGNEPPVPPVNITIDGKPIANELATKALNNVTVKGTPNDPDHEQGVRMLIRMSRGPGFAHYRTFRGTWDDTEQRDIVHITDLSPNTLYYLRLYTQDAKGKISSNYRATSFWTNRPPNPPTLVGPPDNAQFTPLLNVTFEWNHSDPDPSDPQSAFRIRWREAGSPSLAPGTWTVEEHVTTFEQWVMDAGTFKAHTLYEWQIRTRDQQNKWGDWSDSATFFVSGTTQPPLVASPINFMALVAAEDNDFFWTYRNPSGVTQVRADIRYRPQGAAGGLETLPNVSNSDDWTVITGATSANTYMTIPADTFEPGVVYEWQVRTYSTPSTASDWSDSGWFWSTFAPGSGQGLDLVGSGRPAAALGVGRNKVLIYSRGGRRLLGEVKNPSLVRWGRLRDDISSALIQVSEWDADDAAFLNSIHAWSYEVVIFRSNGDQWERVWEGPVTRIASSRSVFEIEAKDVLAYPYRRIMRQGYNDAYRLINGVQVGQKTVVQRSAQIIMNALAYDDPNVLAYLTPLYDTLDAKTSRVVGDFQKTAWEEIDDLAAHAGLDYCASGRRIILWDTHRPIGRLPEMRDGDFSDEIIVTEYGMSGANVFGVTNGNGLWGVATKGLDPTTGAPGPEGFIEQLASAYGENGNDTTSAEQTREQQNARRADLAAQAARNIAGRYPMPVAVRVPDNSALSPDLYVGINQLIPGVWIPLRADAGVRQVSQWQKLDSMTVEQTKDGEKITVVMSPAPNAGEDPDADEAALEEA